MSSITKNQWTVVPITHLEETDGPLDAGKYVTGSVEVRAVRQVQLRTVKKPTAPYIGMHWVDKGSNVRYCVIDFGRYNLLGDDSHAVQVEYSITENTDCEFIDRNTTVHVAALTEFQSLPGYPTRDHKEKVWVDL